MYGNRENRIVCFVTFVLGLCGNWKNEGSALSISRSGSGSGVLSGFRGRTDKRWCACAQYCRNGVVPILVSLPVGNFCFYREIQGFQSKWIVFSITNKITVLPRFPQPRFKGGFFFFPLLTVTNYNNPFI